MPVYLNEMQMGTATDVVGFPHLLVCMGIVALTNNAMYGLHIDVTDQTCSDAAYAALWNFMSGRGAGPITALYGCCNRNVRYGSTPNRLTAWQAEMGRVAAALNNWHGPVSGFDTSIIAPRDGTYVEYRPNYTSGTCAIYYKRNEKMNYTSTVHSMTTGFNPDVTKFNPNSGNTGNVVVETTGATIKPTVFNKGLLHEVNYATRLDTFNV